MMSDEPASHVGTKQVPPRPSTPTRRPSHSPTSPTCPTHSEISLPLLIEPKDLVDPKIDTIITLWRAWPLDWSMVRLGMTIQRLTSALDDHALKPVTDDNIKLYRADQGQASRLMRLMMLESIWKMLIMLDKSNVAKALPFPLVHVREKKDECKVTKIQDDVGVAIRLNGQATQRFEQGQYLKALTIYFQALAVLCPWSCDGSIMTFDQAKASGLADIEQQVLLSIIKAALAWTLLLPINPQIKAMCPIVVDSALQAFEFFPYTTYQGLIELSELQQECMIRWPGHFAPERKRLFEFRRECRDFWKKQQPDDWAHKHCNFKHVCYRS
ncbi:uncharacterized protein I303_104635 [Kwoniella dejecticola CBS 10117]|uniref:Uncharacterized protein n=1 Tax=Kwoniella dejecticola CBS 10117 TaxID=1296121 RepID=A0A1A6A4S5_9TREE|nr:uncharacterized protein I303_04385 [Kwoniella dejecticola CBS 10117]OBR85057.1 hypothetical protein I303_04385 [Kwoniella dejecticola CBS 10117]